MASATRCLQTCCKTHGTIYHYFLDKSGFRNCGRVFYFVSSRFVKAIRLATLFCTSLCAFAVFAGNPPSSPIELAMTMERWILSGAGILYPGEQASPVQDSDCLVYVDESWPQPFQSRIGEAIVIRVSPTTGHYEFLDENGAAFWTIEPADPFLWNWVSPFLSPFHSDDDNIYSPFRLSREWFLTGAKEDVLQTVPLRRLRSPCRLVSSPAVITDFRITSFDFLEEDLSFSADWPEGFPIPGNVIDLWCSTNLSSRTWFWLKEVVATNHPVSFVFSRLEVPGVGASVAIHDTSCLCVTNITVSPTDGETLYTNVTWSCAHESGSEAAFFRLGTRADGDFDGIPDAWERFYYCTDPSLSDTDDDGLMDGEELVLGTDPLNSDSDGDTMPDGWEVFYSLNPLNYADSLLDPDSDGLIHVYEYHSGTHPFVADYDRAYKITVGPGCLEPTLRDALKNSWPYSILEITPGVFEGFDWTDIFMPRHPVLVTTRTGGSSRTVVLRTIGDSLSAFYFDEEQGPHSVFQGIDIELNGGKGYQSAFWLGDGTIYSGKGASAYFRNVHVRLGSAPYVSMGWRCRHYSSSPTILSNCSIDASRTRDAIGVYAIDSPEIILENCSFLNFPDVRQGISYGLETESTDGNFGEAADPIPIHLRNVLFDDSFTNAFAIAPLERGVSYHTTVENCIFPAPLVFPVSETNGAIVSAVGCERFGHLLSGSPAIDAGTTPHFAFVDFDGEPRADCPDIGVDEYFNSSSTDSDEDGLSNTDERRVYGSDPFRFDTDGDGVPDGSEIEEGTDPLDGSSVCFILSGFLSGEFEETSTPKLAIVSTNSSCVQCVSSAIPILGTNIVFSFPHLVVTNHAELFLCLFNDFDSNNQPGESEPKQLEPIHLSGHETCLTTAFRSLSETSDFDNDGIPDVWEFTHGLSNTNAFDVYEDWDGDGLINLHEYWTQCNPVVPDGTNTLLSVISCSVDNRLIGKSSGAALRYFQNYPEPPSGIATNGLLANPFCWAADLDFSCESPWNSVSHNRKSGTLISPIHVLLAKHHQTPSRLPIGTKFTFRAFDGQVFERTLVATNSINTIPDTDFLVGLLNEPLPPNISVAKILPLDFAAYLSTGRGLPSLSLDQEGKILVSDIQSLQAASLNSAVMTTNRRPISSLRTPFYEGLVSGDSSNPKFLLVGDSLILLSIHWYSGHEGTSIREYATLVNEAMNQLTPGQGYELEEFDFSDYPPLP